MDITSPLPLCGKISIGIFQTAECTSIFPVRYRRAVQELRRCFADVEINDYTVYTLPDITQTPQRCAEYFMQAVSGNQLLISLTGGYTTNCILPFLDYDRILEHRPVICGYSDTTALLLAVFSRAGLASVYGPAVLGSYGEWPHINPITHGSLYELLTSGNIVYSEDSVSDVSDCNYYWDKEDMHPLDYTSNCKWQSNSDKSVSGVSFGGNLNTLLAVSGTPYCVFPDNAILFLEDAFTQPDKLKRDIETLHQTNVLSKVSGVVIGKFFQSGKKETVQQMNEYLLNYFTGASIPVMVNVDFGHCYPALSVPVGKTVKADYAARSLLFPGAF